MPSKTHPYFEKKDRKCKSLLIIRCNKNLIFAINQTTTRVRTCVKVSLRVSPSWRASRLVSILQTKTHCFLQDHLHDGNQNLSFFLNKPGDISYKEHPIPELTSPNDVLIAINYTGVCGSDVHYYDHGSIGAYALSDPLIMGHEAAGTVVQVGSGVTSLVPGDRVAIEPGFPCRRCEPCLSGKYNLCDHVVFAASPPHHGTLTGFYVAADDFCYKLPDGVSLREGALVEPLAVAVHMVRQACVSPGTSVVVFGAGPVGILCAAVARVYGATQIVSVDVIPRKLEMAKEVAGATVTQTYLSPSHLSAQDNAAKLLQDTGLSTRGADIVIEASGAVPSVQTGLHVVRKGGSYVQGGMGRSDMEIPMMALCMKEVTVRGSFRYGSGDYRLAVGMVASDQIAVGKLITGVVSFRRAEEAIMKVKSGTAIKVLIAGPNEKLEEGEELR